ncbi:MAG: 50S ribosomal protein L10 [Candidatus Omnitrophica bacterium]|nr:50S ribosomal protein L10 [Candidatus Omnitrophota bacterium]
MVDKYGKKVREKMLNEVKTILTDNKGFFVASLENIKASEIDVLRKQMKRSGSKYVVIKNRITRLALKEMGIDGLDGTLNDKKMLGLGVISEEPVKIAKIMVEFSKQNKGFVVSRGYLDGQVLEGARIKELSELPGREQLIAMVLGTMNAPITGFVSVLSGVLRSLLYAINAVKDKKEESDK